MTVDSGVRRAVGAELRRRRDELVGLLRALIRAHPVYPASGQDEALDLVAGALTAAGLPAARRPVDTRLLRSSPLHVDVPAFGPEFADYFDRPRSAVVADRRFRPGGPWVVLNGHVDVEFVTSPDTWSEPDLWRSGQVVGDRVYGRGASDMLGGVACYVHVLRCLSPHLGAARGGVTVQLVLDEELGGNGTVAELLRPDRQRPDVAFLAEPTDGAVCSTTYGFHQFSVWCRGAPVHMAYAGPGANANRTAARVVELVDRLDDWVADQVRAEPRTRHVLCGVVRGGTDAAVPADRAEVQVTLAVPLSVPLSAVEARLAALLADLDPRPEVRPYGLSFPGSAGIDDRWPDAVLGAAARQQVPLARKEFPSACDARVFEAFGIPAVVWGPGSLARAHASQEYVRIGELEDHCQVLADTLLTLWGLDAA